MYLPQGAVPPNENYCSPGNVPRGCRVRAGIAVPISTQHRRLYEEVQRQVNRGTYKWGTQIVVDGRIGSDTIDKIATVVAHYTAQLQHQYVPRVTDALSVLRQFANDLEYVAEQPASVADALRVVADYFNAPLVVPGPVRTPKPPAPTKQPENLPDLYDYAQESRKDLKWLYGKLSDPLTLSLLGVGALFLVRQWRKGKRGTPMRRGPNRRR